MKSIETNEKYMAYRGQAILCRRLAVGHEGEITAMKSLIEMLESKMTNTSKDWTKDSQSELAMSQIMALDSVHTWAKSKISDLKCAIETLNTNGCNCENICKLMEQKFQHATAEKKQSKQKQREQIWGTSSSTDI